jgi:hypothetical protein
MDESLENIEITPVVVPQTVRTLAIFTYIGNALCALIILIVLMWALSSPVSFSSYITQGSTERLYFDPMGVVIGVLVTIVVCALPIAGAAMMAKGKKTGFWIYLIPNLIWIIINFTSGESTNIFFGFITIGFAIGFATQLKHLK